MYRRNTKKFVNGPNNFIGELEARGVGAHRGTGATSPESFGVGVAMGRQRHQQRAATQGGNMFAGQMGRQNYHHIGSKINKMVHKRGMDQGDNSLSNGYLMYQQPKATGFGGMQASGLMAAGIPLQQHQVSPKYTNQKKSYYSGVGVNVKQFPTTSQGNRSNSINRVK